MKSANSRQVTGTTPRAEADRVNSPSQKILITPPGFCKPGSTTSRRGPKAARYASTAGDGPGTAISVGSVSSAGSGPFSGRSPLTGIPDYIFELHEIALVRSTVAHGWATRLGCPRGSMVSDAGSVTLRGSR